MVGGWPDEIDAVISACLCQEAWCEGAGLSSSAGVNQ